MSDSISLGPIWNGPIGPSGGLPPVSSVFIRWYFQFDDQDDMIFDTTVGPLLYASVGPLWVYDRRLGGALQEPGVWCLLILSPEFAPQLLDHPNLLFVFSNKDGVLFSNIALDRIANLITVCTYQNYNTTGPLSWGLAA